MNNMVRLIVIHIFIILSSCYLVKCQDQSDLQKNLMDKVSDVIDLQSLNETAGSQIEQVQNKLKSKCLKNGDADSYDKLIAAKDNLESCVKKLVNATVLQKEIEEAKPNGNLDIVFKEYCKKKNTFTKCLNKFMSVMEGCLDTNERSSPKIIKNVTDSILDFICFKEGDRIALFIATEGPECFQSKQSDVQECLNATYGSYLPTGNPNVSASLETLPSLMFGIEECSNMESMQRCIVPKLETCSNPTPGNIADALFEFLKKVTPCENILKARMDAQSAIKTNSAKTLNNISIQSVFIITITFLFLYF